MNEKDYPMSYEEYEKKVVELFLQDYSGKTLEIMKSKVDEVLSESPSFIEQLYGYDCFTYESPDIYGDNALKVFEDDFLRQTAVSQLRMLIG